MTQTQGHVDPRFKTGDRVVMRNHRDVVGVVYGPSRIMQGDIWYPVHFGGRGEQVREEDLELFRGGNDPRSLIDGGTYGSNRVLSRRLMMTKMSQPLRNAIYSFEASRTEFHPYQFRPLVKLLEAERPRLLIADEVGLGKTIEAGYILQEQKARHDIERVLVICPASLRNKWQTELAHRFAEDFEVLDAKSFRERAVIDIENDSRHRRLQAIVSLQSARSEAVMDALEQRPAQFDLLIVDEAHHCRNRGTRQHRVVQTLALASEAVVFLTATPLMLGNENLFNLLSLLLPEEFDRLDVFERMLQVNRHIVRAETLIRRGDEQGLRDAHTALIEVERTADAARFRSSSLYQQTRDRLLTCPPDDRQQIVELQDSLSRLNLIGHVMTRTKRRDVRPKTERRPSVVSISMTEAESTAYREISRFCFDRHTQLRNDSAARLAVVMLEQMMASSIHASLDYYKEALDLNQSAPTDGIDEGDDDLAAISRPNAPVDAGPRALLSDNGFRRLIRQCLELPLAQRDSKYDELYKLLKRQSADGAKAVVFSYFKRSLRYLERRLNEDGIGCVRIDGDVPTCPQNPADDERLQRTNAFRNDPEVSVLLSSEVGSEGLDFQFCHTLVNWDLPWNPMKVEQRIGRLDRLGQRSDVILIFNFAVPGTIEDEILRRLYHRVGLFEGAIGPLEPILGERVQELTARLFDASLSPEARQALIEQESLALARELQDSQRLEQQAESLLGHDQFFQDQLERVRRLGRYVTPEETRLFVEDFLSTEFSSLSLGASGPRGAPTPAGCHWLQLAPELVTFLRQQLAVNDPMLLRLLERSGQRHILVTFDNTIALNHPGVDLIHSQHPLVRAITRYYDQTPDRIQSTGAAVVATDAVPPADYFYAFAELVEQGPQAGRLLIAECISIDEKIRPSQDDSELLLHHAAVRGTPWQAFQPPSAESSLRLLNLCEEAIVARVKRRETRARQEAQTRVDSRIASLQASFMVRQAEKRRLLDIQIERGNQRAIPLFEAQLRRLEADHAEKVRQIEGKKGVSLTYSIQGAGFLRVNPITTT